MTPQFAKQLFLYCNLLVAIANGGITWIVLIIAPLGLFAVIMNTALVFGSSLIFSVASDRLLKNLLNSAGIEILQARRDIGQFSQPSLDRRETDHLPKTEQPHLPKDY